MMQGGASGEAFDNRVCLRTLHQSSTHRSSCLDGRGILLSSPKWRHSASGCRPCSAGGTPDTDAMATSGRDVLKQMGSQVPGGWTASPEEAPQQAMRRRGSAQAVERGSSRERQSDLGAKPQEGPAKARC